MMRTAHRSRRDFRTLIRNRNPERLWFFPEATPTPQHTRDRGRARSKDPRGQAGVYL